MGIGEKRFKAGMKGQRYVLEVWAEILCEISINVFLGAKFEWSQVFGNFWICVTWYS